MQCEQCGSDQNGSQRPGLSKRCKEEAHRMRPKTDAIRRAVHAGPGHMHAIIRLPSRSTQPHQTSAPYNQQSLHLVSSLRTSTQRLLRGRNCFLRERVFSKNTSRHASVPLSKRLTFANEPGVKKKTEEELAATAVEMGRTALKAVINLVEIGQCVDLPQLLEHRVVDGCMTLFNSNGSKRASSSGSSLCNV